ncbi:pyridine nucleotide-disulfide oxidoreductase family protein [Synechococcus sp. RS9909]|nr:NADH oxidase (putative) [Synechococcus sp. RS9917]QNI79036.1 pyridine nucleotide-disulfide oxidoreductase family protein [Synechococcus sp. RS9909]
MIIGGSDAGISAAIRIRELDTNAEVSVLLRDAYPNYSICGLPFLISGQTAMPEQLAHRSLSELERLGLQIQAHTTAVAVDASRQTVETHKGHRIPYDRLILATGARARRPQLAGVDEEGVFSLRWMGDALRLQSFLLEQQPRHAVIVGGGYIGLEMADALHRRGLQLAVVEHNTALLRTVHASLASSLQQALLQRGHSLHLNQRLRAIHRQGRALAAELSDGSMIHTEMVLLAVGAVPATELAASAGIALGAGGAMVVDRQMRTGVDQIWAAGDGVETYHRLLQRHGYQPLGTNAHKQGRIAGENALGGSRHYAGTLGSQVVQVFDQVVARTGLRSSEAEAAGWQARSAAFKCWSHKAYVPGAGSLHFRITGDDRSGRLLGAQMVGPAGAEVAKRLDTFAQALFHELTIEAISDLDLCYTPPLSSPWDPVQMAAQHWCLQRNAAA